jgi:hypothetical protein
MDILKKPFPNNLDALTLVELELVFREHVEALRKREAEDPHCKEETEEDQLLTGRMRKLMAYRPVAAARYRSLHPVNTSSAKPSATESVDQAGARIRFRTDALASTLPDVATSSHNIEFDVNGNPTDCPPDLVRSYREAIYEVDWFDLDSDSQRQTRRLVLDQPCRVLEEVFNITGCRTSAFVTAQNPFFWKDIKSDAELHQELVSEVQAQLFRALSGRGRDVEGRWPAEESLLVIGCSRDAAISLGYRFAQNAILCSDGDFIPRLLLLR